MGIFPSLGGRILPWNDEPRPPRGPNSADHFAEALDRLVRKPENIAFAIVAVCILIAVAAALLTSFYTVDTQENAVILRFGKLLPEPIGPGLHWKLPYGVDRVYKEKVKEVKKEEFGYRTIQAGVESSYQVTSSVMLTGDLNVANVRWVVRYRIRDLAKYLFNLRDARAIVQDVSNAVMRRVVGDYSVDEVITIGRQDIQMSAQDQMQRLLRDYGAGVDIVAVRLQESTPPEEVRAAFNEVNRSLQEKEKTIQEAKGKRNDRVPAARGEKERVILEAEGYKTEKINNAQGDVKEFDAVLEQYAKAKEITRQRLYLETMEKILPNAGKKFIVDKESDILKLLPFDAMPARGGSQ